LNRTELQSSSTRNQESSSRGRFEQRPCFGWLGAPVGSGDRAKRRPSPECFWGWNVGWRNRRPVWGHILQNVELFFDTQPATVAALYLSRCSLGESGW